MEYITNRSIYWKVDFSDIEKLTELFVISVNECTKVQMPQKYRAVFTPAYTFRICIGCEMWDIIC